MQESRRTRMTKTLIKESFLDILDSTPFDKISVTQICEAADVNRSTFYAHYEDTRQLLREIENDVLEQIPVPENIPAIYTEDSFLIMLTQFLKYIRKKERTFRLLMMSNETNSFSERVISSVFESYSNMKLVDDSLLSRYGYIFSINGVIGLVKEWIASGFPIDEKALAQLSLTMARQANIAIAKMA